MADTNPSLESRIGNPRDPGAVDNRLSLDPNDPSWKNMISGWEDGEEYEIKLTVTQISPGEYEVTGASGKNQSESGEDEDEVEDEDESEDMPMESRPKVRKAVRQMMMREGM